MKFQLIVTFDRECSQAEGKRAVRAALAQHGMFATVRPYKEPQGESEGVGALAGLWHPTGGVGALQIEGSATIDAGPGGVAVALDNKTCVNERAWPWPQYQK